MRKKRIKTLKQKEQVIGYLFMVPILALIGLLIAFPFIKGIVMSMSEYRIGKAIKFIGIANYAYLILKDPTFWPVALNSIIYTVSAVALKITLGLCLALVLNRKFRGEFVVRALLLLPWVIPTALSAQVWTFIFHDSAGFLNQILMDLHLIDRGVAWLARMPHAMLAVIGVNVWRGLPFFGIAMLAGMKAIPQELYDAANMDGASRIHLFRYITLPHLKYIMVIVTLFSTIWTFSDFQIIYLITRGGPAGATNVFATYTYQVAFMAGRLGRGAAISLFMLPVLFVLMLFLTRILAKE